MKRVAALFLLALSLPLAARADDASHRAKAQEMMSLLHSQQMVQNIADGLKKQLPDAATAVVGTSPSPEKKAHADEFVKHADQVVDSQLGWSSLEPAFIDIYVKNFTEEQLDAIIAFYKTPAGLALLTTMPTINNQISQYGNQRLTDVIKPQLKQLYDDFRKADGAPATPPAPASAPHPQGTPK